jgi:hypothetical protein
MNQRLAFGLVASLSVSLGTFALVGCGGSTSSNPGGPANDGGGSDATPVTGDSGPSNDGGSPDAGTPAEACAAYAEARCTQLDACSNATYTVLHYGTQTTCMSNVAAECVNALAAPQTAATPRFYAACAAAVATESCANLFGANPPAACAPLAGPLATGSPCFASGQCQTTYCAVPSTANCGVCAAVPVAGNPCSVDADCGSRNQLTCSKAGTCVTYGELSASCDKNDPCSPGLSCVGADAKKGLAGTCNASAATVGAACDPATGATCDAMLLLTCDAATKQCVADTLVGASQVCGAVNGGAARCETSGTCVIPDAGVVDDAGDAGVDAGPAIGTCLAAAANGSACDSANGPACVPPAKCVTTDDASTAGTCLVGVSTACN